MPSASITRRHKGVLLDHVGHTWVGRDAAAQAANHDDEDEVTHSIARYRFFRNVADLHSAKIDVKPRRKNVGDRGHGERADKSQDFTETRYAKGHKDDQ